MIGIELAERQQIPDFLIRLGIRELLRRRRRALCEASPEQAADEDHAFREALRRSPIALHTDLANAQHYEVPAEFFETVLGRNLKYSCALFADAHTDLDAAEDAMLALTCERAGIEDGMEVLDLGCGWGSLSLWIARQYPGCRVLGVSNSKSQREFILSRAAQLGLSNVDVVTRDANVFDPDRRFDRIASVEMIEHVRNWELLLHRVSRWLLPGGKAFFHHFAHRARPYAYETSGEDDWMGRHFFTGGIMPSDDLMNHFQRDLIVERSWRVSGVHYQRTCEAWLERQDAARSRLMPVLARVYGPEDARAWFGRWRIFFMACAELFGARGGEEWWVKHVLLSQREGASK